ncbi:hypothetical protein EVA_11260 [gut metagenome]|uniref:Uncharacterized protein n=1 Tax=gut metagenome TaxID=749906 RepID=J9GLK2_9ZZZZ
MHSIIEYAGYFSLSAFAILLPQGPREGKKCLKYASKTVSRWKALCAVSNAPPLVAVCWRKCASVRLMRSPLCAARRSPKLPASASISKACHQGRVKG